MLSLNSIGQIAINARDLPRAVAFYRDTLGMRHLFDAGPRMSFFDCGGVRLLIETNDQPEHAHPASIIYYSVSDIQSAHQALVDKGANIVAPPAVIAKMPGYDLWMTFFEDTEGNTLALMSEVRP